MARASKVGRPSKFTPETRKRLLDAIRMGNYRESSCNYAGISVSTFYAWLDKGKKQNRGEFVEFLEAVTRAEADAEVRMIAQWQAQIPKDWRAARDFLVRRFPERWGPRARMEIDHSGERSQSPKELLIPQQLASDMKFLAAIQIAYQEINCQNRGDDNG